MLLQITVLDPGCGWITANQRHHWGKVAHMTKLWREQARAAALRADPPMLEAARIVAVLRFQDSRRRDPANWAPTVKACIDGVITGQHSRDKRLLLPDDDRKHLIGPDLRVGETVHRDQPLRVELYVQPLKEAA